MATIAELKEHLENGGKIRRPYWEEGAFIKLIGNTFVGENGLEYPFSPEDALYCYWEVYEKPFWITHTGLYKTRAGKKAYVSFISNDDCEFYGVIDGEKRIMFWYKSGGIWKYGGAPEDIVAEWED